MNRREERLNWEWRKLAPWAYLSRWGEGPDQRKHLESPDAYRTAFQKDRDRILTCSYFRQLSSKTQVYTYFYSDLFRRRLTHTIEVNRLSKTLSDYLYTNDHLVEAVAFGHDLGHAPFGHIGEKCICETTTLGTFAHAVQSLRVVDLLIDDYWEERQRFGLNLTHAVRESIVKHTYYGDAEKPKDTVGLFPNMPQPIEGQIVQKADMIASFVADFEDALEMQLLTVEDIKETRNLEEYIRRYNKGRVRYEDVKSPRAFRGMLTWALMQDVIDTTTKRLRLKFPGGGNFINAVTKNIEWKPDHNKDTIDDMIRIPKELVPEHREKCYMLQWDWPNVVRFSKLGQQVAGELWLLREKRIWKSNLVERMNQKAQNVVSSLIEIFLDLPRLMYHNQRPYQARFLEDKYHQEQIDYKTILAAERHEKAKDENANQVVVDYVCSLSDMTAIEEHERLTDPNRRVVSR